MVARVRELKTAMYETKTPMSKVATILYQSVMKNFSEEGSEKGKWTPLSPITTGKRRQREGASRRVSKLVHVTGKSASSFKHRILQDTGFMKSMISPHFDNTSAEVGLYGEMAKLGMVHQKGTKRAGVSHNVRIPARPFITLRPEYRQRIVNVISQWLKPKQGATQ